MNGGRRPGHNGRGYTAYQRAFRAGYYGQTLEAAGVRLTRTATVEATPGPWIVETWRDLSNETVYGLVGSTKAGPDVAQANARLIAAAPDLLEAAKELVRREHGQPNQRDRAFDLLRSAIARAEGVE